MKTLMKIAVGAALAVSMATFGTSNAHARGFIIGVGVAPVYAAAPYYYAPSPVVYASPYYYGNPYARFGWGWGWDRHHYYYGHRRW